MTQGVLTFFRNVLVPRTRNPLQLVEGKGLIEQTIVKSHGTRGVMGQAAVLLDVLCHESHDSL